MMTAYLDVFLQHLALLLTPIAIGHSFTNTFRVFLKNIGKNGGAEYLPRMKGNVERIKRALDSMVEQEERVESDDPRVGGKPSEGVSIRIPLSIFFHPNLSGNILRTGTARFSLFFYTKENRP
ncbi:MAG TPA: hypothetical protein DCZ97_11925 [Syntrophus sp. (in: bacteria)]|nr:hypothetical protein [Syntrophus sp. (in: bacteria)]